MTGRVLSATVVAALVCLACDTGPPPPALDLPPRPDDAPGGAEIARALRTLDFAEREERILMEVARGNVPGWLRHLERVEITGEADGRDHRVTFWAMPDYLSLGSDTDFFYVPVSPRTALRIAELVGGLLPTPGMVDAIWASARVRLIPVRFRPDEHIRTVRYFERHNRVVQAQLKQRRARPGVFVAGHKLDIVLPSLPTADPEDVALYGWHRSNGTPIQPVHRIDVDGPPHFSMGLRVVHRSLLVDDARTDLSKARDDPELARLLAGLGVVGGG